MKYKGKTILPNDQLELSIYIQTDFISNDDDDDDEDDDIFDQIDNIIAELDDDIHDSTGVWIDFNVDSSEYVITTDIESRIDTPEKLQELHDVFQAIDNFAMNSGHELFVNPQTHMSVTTSSQMDIYDDWNSFTKDYQV